jgi:hypothetical protein
LIFPRGVRFPLKEEIPGDPSDVIDRIAEARITTGYVVNTAEDQHFTTYIEANVHAPDVFETFRKLVFALMPDVAAPIIGIKDDEPVFGPYTDRVWAFNIFEPYADLLQNDGFLEFGVIHQSEQAFEEVFIDSTKYFKIWTNQRTIAEEVLQAAGIPPCETLQFIDEYPMVSLSLDENRHAAWTGPLNAIQDEFRKLPKPTPPE